MKLLVATTNTGKLEEIYFILSDLPWLDLESLRDHPGIAEAEEIGTTFAENARIKATRYSTLTTRLTVAEDSGLEIDALDGAPGVRSARFNGASYPEKFAAIRAQLKAQGTTESTARFVCALAVVDGTSVIFETTETIEGLLSPDPRGTGGFGYDPVFFYPPYECTLAEVSGEKKSAVSHRGKAVRRLRSFLVNRSDPTRPR